MRIIQLEKDNSTFQVSGYPDSNVDEWRGVTVFWELGVNGELSPETYNLLTLARRLADQSEDKTQLLLIGPDLVPTARGYFAYGIDRVFVYDDPLLAEPTPEQYHIILSHFIDNFKPETLIFPDTPLSQLLSESVIAQTKSAGNVLTNSYIQKADNPAAPTFPPHGELVICEIPEGL